MLFVVCCLLLFFCFFFKVIIKLNKTTKQLSDDQADKNVTLRDFKMNSQAVSGENTDQRPSHPINKNNVELVKVK